MEDMADIHWVKMIFKLSENFIRRKDIVVPRIVKIPNVQSYWRLKLPWKHVVKLLAIVFGKLVLLKRNLAVKHSIMCVLKESSCLISVKMEMDKDLLIVPKDSIFTANVTI